MKVGKTFSFDAAHQLPNHDGKCRRPHGHTYKLVVEVEGPVQEPNPEIHNPKEGMVIDFADLKAIWKDELEPKLDHQDLNVTLADVVPVTTCEMLATWIRDTFFNSLNTSLTPPMQVRVRLWETPTSYAEV